MGAVHALAADAAGLEVVAVASAGGDSARHLAGQLEARRAAPADLPAGADLVVVATPPATHAALALQCVRAGAVVLVEKPLSATLAEADLLTDAAAEHPGRLVVAENLLHAPAWRAARDHGGGLGELTHVSARTLQPPPNWGHFTRPLTAGGVLFDLGPHPVALVLELVAVAPIGVAAELRSSRPDGADDEADVRLRFADGTAVSIEVSWTAPEPVWDLQVAGTTGVVRLELFPDTTVERDGEPVTVPAPRHHGAADPSLETFGYVDQLADLATGGGACQTVAGAALVLEVITAAYASGGRGGEEVALPFAGDRTLTPLQHWRG